jgi:membrane carboxypeptidase/penicillin-binding protein PbpC
VSPNGKEILLVSKKTIPLRAKADADVREIFWFAGKQFLGKVAPNQILEWTTAAGDFEITAMDDHGRAGSHSVAVRWRTIFGDEQKFIRATHNLLNPKPRRPASQ